MHKFQQKLQLLSKDTLPYFKSLINGIEKEGLRVTNKGTFSTKEHSNKLGSALCNKYITTDYAENLLELITPPANNSLDVLKSLQNLHYYTYQNIGDEYIWAASMPPSIDNQKIKIAKYGTSAIGQMKHIYRQGLTHRYKQEIQLIAGLHLNISFNEDLWSHYYQKEVTTKDINKAYFNILRNLEHYNFVLLYLFGNSAVFDKSFNKNFTTFNNNSYKKNATSLRLSNIGYASQNINISLNSTEEYVNDLRHALNTNHAPYQKIDQQYGSLNAQLNSNLLQIENEFYSLFRPKRNTTKLQSPCNALATGGVEYIEIRLFDLNINAPLGIEKVQIDFMNLFFIFCLLEEREFFDKKNIQEIALRKKLTIHEGRDTNLLLPINNQEQKINVLLEEIFEKLTTLSEAIDYKPYKDALIFFKSFIKNPALCYSSQILETIKENNMSYHNFILEKSIEHKQTILQQKINSIWQNKLHKETENSLKTQHLLEQEESSLEELLTIYYKQNNL